MLLQRLLCLYFIAPLCFVFSAHAPRAQQIVDPMYNDAHPPQVRGGKVDDADTSFFYLSDVEDSGENRHELVAWIHNVHSRNALIFNWPAAGIFRNPLYPLPPDGIELGSIPVCGYSQHPTDATLYYTQHSRPKLAPAYIRSYSCQAGLDVSLLSYIQTLYTGEDMEVHQQRFNLTSSFNGKEIVYEITTEPSAPVAIGGLAEAIASLNGARAEDVLDDFRSSAESAGASVMSSSFAELIDGDFKDDFITSELENEAMLLLMPMTEGDSNGVSWSLYQTFPGQWINRPAWLSSPLSGVLLSARPI